jgi:hypothetical protein
MPAQPLVEFRFRRFSPKFRAQTLMQVLMLSLGNVLKLVASWSDF